jgi:hypothetical protein
MQIVKNTLSTELIQSLCKFAADNVDNPIWGCSLNSWGSDVLMGIFGGALFTEIKDELREKLVAEITPYLPPHTTLLFRLTQWLPLSGLSPHTDSDYGFAATLYLNQNWHPGYGGLFVWREDNDWKMLCPEFNTMVIVDNNEEHLVTPITLCTNQSRFSLQIWADV